MYSGRLFQLRAGEKYRLKTMYMGFRKITDNCIKLKLFIVFIFD